jgi:Leucine-rich repeat (LRR) protein
MIGKQIPFNELYDQLKQAYRAENLNKISLTLIALYSEKDFDSLRQIAEIIGDLVEIAIAPNGKGFTKFMMLYHPDRGEYYRNEIEQSFLRKDYDRLLSYAHILRLNEIEEIAAAIDSYEDIDYSPVFSWDINEDGYSVVDDPDEPILHRTRDRKPEGTRNLSFYEAVQIRMYGNTHIEFPSYYLEDLDELELSQSGINDLEGVQFCSHTIILDLSENCIDDLSLLWNLSQLEELNLEGNRISMIDDLANLQNLRSLNLANNCIDDLSPLYTLNSLKYLDVSGNSVHPDQLMELKELGITVISTDI